jgi:UDP-glucose 4-epimerase
MGSTGSVLVVGGAGYIGCHMVKALLENGYPVVVLDNLSTGNERLRVGGTFVRGDLGDADLLDRVFEGRRIDAVMHFAAFSLVGESVVDPIKYYRNNVAGTSVLIESMLKHGVGNFIFSSTAAVYGEPNHTPINEAHPCQPTNPYGASKLAVERMLQDCSQAYDSFRYVALRYFNAAGADPSGTIGEMHDPESHLIPLLLKVANGERKEIKIFGNDYQTHDGTCIRDYVHVNDLVAAHLLALEKLRSGKGAPEGAVAGSMEGSVDGPVDGSVDGLAGKRANVSAVYNLGNSKGYSVYDVLRVARQVSGKPIPDRLETRRSGDPAVLVADSEKIRRELGWQPKFEDLESIVETAWRWHRH